MSFGDLKSQIMRHKTVMSVLAVSAVAAFINMVSSAHCADMVKRSGCVDSDNATAKEAYQGAWVMAMLSSFVLIGAGVGTVFFLLKK